MPTASGFARGSASDANALNGQHAAQHAKMAAGNFFTASSRVVIVVVIEDSAFDAGETAGCRNPVKVESHGRYPTRDPRITPLR
jgi:hypothetical protein